MYSLSKLCTLFFKTKNYILYIIWGILMFQLNLSKNCLSWSNFLLCSVFPLGFLLTLIELKYQNSNDTLFHGYSPITIHSIELRLVTLPTSHNSSLFFFEVVSLISRPFAYDLLLLILIPPFGCFRFVIYAFGCFMFLIQFVSFTKLILNFSSV